MKHIIVYNVKEERFALSANMFFKIIPNCILIEGNNLKSLEFSGLIESWEEYCLHFMCHGSPGSLECKTSQIIGAIGKQLLKNQTNPKVIFIYACHAADENGTAKKMYEYYGKTVPLVGIGKCESISVNDKDDNPIPAGGPISFMYSLLKSEPSDLVINMVKEIKSPSICKIEDKSENIVPKGAALYTTDELNTYTIEQIFGSFSKEHQNDIKILYDYLFQDVCAEEKSDDTARSPRKRNLSEEEKSDDTARSPRKRARPSPDGRRRRSPRRKGKGKGRRKSP